MTLRISEVAVCCSSASSRSRVSRATSFSCLAAEELRRRTVFGPLRRFSVAAPRSSGFNWFAACSGAPSHGLAWVWDTI